MPKPALIANRGEIARALLPLSLAERGRGVRGVKLPRDAQACAQFSLFEQRTGIYAPHPLAPSPPRDRFAIPLILDSPAAKRPEGRRGMVRAC